eukprot:766423-Hanusia_phi.AAC.1
MFVFKRKATSAKPSNFYELLHTSSSYLPPTHASSDELSNLGGTTGTATSVGMLPIYESYTSSRNDNTFLLDADKLENRNVLALLKNETRLHNAVRGKYDLTDILGTESLNVQFNRSGLKVPKKDTSKVIELSIACEDLPPLPRAVGVDPLCVVYKHPDLILDKNELWKEVNVLSRRWSMLTAAEQVFRTERVTENSSPKFQKVMRIRYHGPDKSQPLKFCVFDNPGERRGGEGRSGRSEELQISRPIESLPGTTSSLACWRRRCRR